jgi:FkbM family methyltransferase
MILFLFFGVCSALSADDLYFSVTKNNIVHKFAKSNVEWIDRFLEHTFHYWENDTFAIFEKVKDKQGIAIDVGAWIGTTAICLSKNFAHVIAVEPDRLSLFYLEKNLIASDCFNVTICDRALTKDGDPVIFGPRLSMGHGDALNGSTSYVKDVPNSENDYIAETITIKQLLCDYIAQNPHLNDRKITFIKCDIEGGEENILQDLLEFAHANRSKVWLSFHTPWWSKRTVKDFEGQFKKFKANVPDVTTYIIENPFGSVLLEPL